MKKTLLEIYSLLVCFVAVIAFSIAAGIAIYDCVQSIYPELTLRWNSYSRHQNNENFIEYRKKDFKGKSTEEVTKIREESYKVVLSAERRSGLQSLMRMFIVILVNIALFLVHWKIRKKLLVSI